MTRRKIEIPNPIIITDIVKVKEKTVFSTRQYPELIKEFKTICKSRGLKQNQVLEALMQNFITSIKRAEENEKVDNELSDENK